MEVGLGGERVWEPAVEADVDAASAGRGRARGRRGVGVDMRFDVRRMGQQGDVQLHMPC
jgi:hypothetical protein